MDYIDDAGQKIKGKAEEIKGEINQKRGKGVKGGMQKIKGKARQKMAEEKMKARKAEEHREEEEEWDY